MLPPSFLPPPSQIFVIFGEKRKYIGEGIRNFGLSSWLGFSIILSGVGQKYILSRPNLHTFEAKSTFSIPRENPLSNRKTDTKRAHFIFLRNTHFLYTYKYHLALIHETTRIDRPSHLFAMVCQICASITCYTANEHVSKRT